MTIIATSHLLLPGWYVSLCTLGSEAMPYAMNGACVPVLTVANNNTFTVSATYGGQTMPDGDYSIVNGQTWTIHNQQIAKDSSFARALNYQNGNPFFFVANYSYVNATATQIKNVLSKITAGPAFDCVFLCMGTNSLNGGGAITLANAMRNGQIAFNDLVQVSETLFGINGARVILFCPPPFGAAVTNALEKNKALLQLRYNLLQYAKKNSWLTIIDTFADIVDGTSVVGAGRATFLEGPGVHTSSLGNFNIAKYNAAKYRALGLPIDLQPVTILDDADTYAQTLPAWTANTLYDLTLPNDSWVVRNGGNLYQLIQSGRSAASGGPTGTGTSIVDGGCIWKYIAPYARNVAGNGLMTGTAAFAGTLTGTAPTGWLVQNVAAVTGVLAGQAARDPVANSNAALQGYGFNCDLTFASQASQYFIDVGDSTALIPGQWYRAGIRVTALANWNNISNIRLLCDYTNGVLTTQPKANEAGNNTTTLPLLDGDVLELWTEPFYMPVGWVPTQALTFIYIDSAGAGAANFQLSNLFWKAVENPYV
jgi:hypothetical protein